MDNFSKKAPSVKHLNPNGLTFSLFSEEEIKQLSVVKITTPMSFNTLGHPYKGGLYDSALGPMNDKSDPCSTCSYNAYNCAGHFGHIELPIPALNPLFFKTVHNIIKLSCLSCHVVQVKGVMKHVYITKLKLLNNGYFIESETVDEIVAECMKQENNSSHDAAMAVLIKEKLDGFYVKCLKGNEDNEMIDKGQKTRIIESLINNLINTMEKSKPDFKQCYNCYASLKKITTLKKRLLTNVRKGEVIKKGEDTEDGCRIVSTVILPDELRNHLRKLWTNDKEFILAFVPVLADCSMEFPTDAFFISVISVPPTKMRPVNYQDDRLVEHPQTGAFRMVLQSSIILNNILKAVQDGSTKNIKDEGKALVDQMKGKSLIEKLNFAYEELQTNVNNLIDSSQGYGRKALAPGIKQVIEKKEGVIRMHMMGKRVNFAARTVITPDPCLNIEEIGIPEAFAKHLTYPVPVTMWNVAELRRMVLNGPDVYPGAVRVQNEDGFVIKLAADKPNHRASIAKCLLTPDDKRNTFKQMKIVHRHLCTGDVLLLNRQPTLHRPGIMAHVARILKGEKTIRMHYANCKAYNADFDGDEMNAHFPQNEVARSEAYNLLNVQNQYLVPKDGTPLSGLIQDHVIAGVKLSVRGQFFQREDYQQLVYQALSYKKKEIKLLPPAILKPFPMWSGKQIISTVIINVVPEGQHPLNLNSIAKISDKAWIITKPRRWKAGGTPFTDKHAMSEAEVIIRDGELLCGVLDKTHYGATPYGLVHCMNELYGGRYSSNILSAFSKLFNAFLQIDGFTLGIEDILVVDDAEDDRLHFIREARKIGDTVAKYAVNLPETAPFDELTASLEDIYENKARGQAIVDSCYKEHLDKYTNNINKTCIPKGLHKCFPHNNLQLMIQSGAKGSTVNAMQISCLLGQIELEGRRPSHMVSGKNLPSFARYDTTPRAGGFIDGRFMTGIKPQEFFYHCMAGREGLIDTAVKTSRSGYLQRCLVKHLEGLVVAYDTTVRDSDGTVVQFCYGEDGKDVMKAQFLKKKQIPFLADNCKSVLNVPLNDMKDSEVFDLIRHQRKEIQKWTMKHGNPVEKRSRVSPFSLYSIDIRSSIPTKKFEKLRKEKGRTKAAELMCEMWRDADRESLKRYYSKSKRCRDPVTADFQIDRDFGALTEQLDNLITEYSEMRAQEREEELRQMICVKSLQSSCHPGEPVGLLAAQSVGEPSTQMTLNTFHFAGRGEMNVTLGIPRLRELLLTASKSMKTPYMDVPFKSHVKHVEKKANKMKLNLCRVTLADVLQRIEVTDKLQTDHSRRYVYEIYMQFLPREAYKSKFCVKPADILNYVEKYFIKSLFTSLKRIWKLKSVLLHSEVEKSNKRGRDDEDSEGGGDDNIGEEQPNAKRTNVGEDHQSSDEEEGNEDDDATLSRSKTRHTENQEYEESENDEDDEETTEDEDDTPVRNSKIGNTVEEENSETDDNMGDSSDELNEEVKKQAISSYDSRRSKVIQLLPFIEDYNYDIQHELWCKLKFAMPLSYKRLDLTSQLRDVAAKSVIWEVPMIKRAITYVNAETQQVMLKTEGINFQEIFKFNKRLDLNKIYSNDVHQMAATYGIEAARRVIVKEIQDVFKVYGIVVDPRHLLLIADYMTINGTYEPFSRKGIEDNVSPLQQMSFEAPIIFLKTAISRGKRDDLRSPSSRLMLGQPCISGTGCFSLLNKLQPIKDLGF